MPRLVQKNKYVYLHTIREGNAFRVANQRGRILAQSERENPYPCYIRYRYYPIREEVYSHLPNERGKIFPSLQPERCVNKEY